MKSSGKLVWLECIQQLLQSSTESIPLALELSYTSYNTSFAVEKVKTTDWIEIEINSSYLLHPSTDCLSYWDVRLNINSVSE